MFQINMYVHTFYSVGRNYVTQIIQIKGIMNPHSLVRLMTFQCVINMPHASSLFSYQRTYNIKNISIVFIHIPKLNTPYPHLG